MCACGRAGCLQTLMGETALREFTDGLDPGARDRVHAAIGTRLGIVLAPIVARLNVADIVASGPEALLAGSLLKASAREIRERTLPRSHRALRVRLSKLGSDGGLRGAAVLVLSGRLGIA